MGGGIEGDGGDWGWSPDAIKPRGALERAVRAGPSAYLWPQVVLPPRRLGPRNECPFQSMGTANGLPREGAARPILVSPQLWESPQPRIL